MKKFLLRIFGSSEKKKNSFLAKKAEKVLTFLKENQLKIFLSIVILLFLSFVLSFIFCDGKKERLVLPSIMILLFLWVFWFLNHKPKKKKEVT